jgi:hypothetical protein
LSTRIGAFVLGKAAFHGATVHFMVEEENRLTAAAHDQEERMLAAREAKNADIVAEIRRKVCL